METSEGQRAEAAAALDLVADSRAAVAERLIPPRWYYPALGVTFGGFIAGGLIASTALPADSLNWIWMSVMFAFALVAGWLLPRAYRRATGFSGRRWPPPGRPLLWWIALVLGTGAPLPAGAALQAVWGWVGPVLAGVVAVPVVIVLGPRYDAAVRAHLRGRG